MSGHRVKISNRIRCYHRHINGTGNSAKRTWAEVERLAKNEDDNEKFTMPVDTVVGWSEQLRAALEDGDGVDNANAIADLCCDETHAGTIIQLGNWVSHVAPGSKKDEALLEASAEFRDALLKATGTLLESDGYHTDVLAASPAVVTLSVDSEAEVKIVRDKVYFEDIDNLPESVQVLLTTRDAFNCAKVFPHAHSKLIEDASHRADLAIESWKVGRYDITPEYTALDKLRGLADLSRRTIWSAKQTCSGRVMDPGAPEVHVQTFCDKASNSEQLGGFITELIESELIKGGVHSIAIIRELSVLETSMPRSTHKMVGAAKAIERVEDLNTMLLSGKGLPNLVDVNRALHEYASQSNVMPRVVAGRKSLHKAKTGLGAEFGAAFSLFEGKITRMERSCETVMKKVGNIHKRIPIWNFKTCHTAALRKEDSDADFESAARGVGVSVAMFENFKQTAAELAARNIHHPPTIKENAAAIAAKFAKDEYRGPLDEAVSALAHSSIVNAILNSASPTDEKTWPGATAKTLVMLKTHLQFPIDKLNTELVGKITKAVATSKASSVSGGASSSSKAVHPSSASTKAPDSVASVASVSSGISEPPKKKPRFVRKGA